jgi:four helix bundle protein
MNNAPYSLGDRTVTFSKNVLTFCSTVPASNITRPIIDQLIRSATSIGANYAEANNAASKVDFRNKIFIAKKEAAETEYWLTLIDNYSTDKNGCSILRQECHYLLMIFQKIINTLRSTSENGKRTVNSKR